MATTYTYSVPDMLYQNPYYQVYMIPNNNNSAQLFSICKNYNNEMVFHANYCGNSTAGSWISTMQSFYNLDWASDSSITTSSNIVFPINQSSTGAYIIDWNNPIIMANPYDYGNLVSTNMPVVGGVSHTIEESSGGNGSTEQPSDPCDNPYSGVISAIYTCAAVPFVICFFLVIYKLFMRLRG